MTLLAPLSSPIPKGRAVAILIGVAVLMLGVTAWERPWQSDSSANELRALSNQLAPTLFEVPVPVSWSGVITRSLAGGRGLEIRASRAPGGYFFVYWSDGRVAQIRQGTVRVQGDWLGISCEYGRCAPEVQATSVVPSAP